MKKFLFLLTVVTALTILTSLPTQAATYSDFTLGKNSAPVKMEVFNDFQCPYCARFHRTLSSGYIQRLVRTGKLQIIFKDFPLEFHTNAQTAARASNAVLSLNPRKYRAYMNFIFRTQAQWAAMEGAMKFFADRAEEMGIDPNDFQTAFNDLKNRQEITEDIADGTDQNVSGTPSYTINGELQAGSQSLGTLLQQIREAHPDAPSPGAPATPQPEIQYPLSTQPDQSISGNVTSRGNSIVNIMESRVTAYLEDYKIDSLTLSFNTNPGFGFSTVKQVNIVAHGKIYRSFPAAAVMTINGLNIPAEKNKDTPFFIQLVLGNVGPSSGMSGEKVSISIDSASAINSRGGRVLLGGFPLSSSTITVYGSSITLTPNPLPTPNLSASSDQTIADFTAKTNGDGRAGWISLRLSINKTGRAVGIGATSCYLRNVSNGSSNIPGTCTVTSTDPLNPSANTIPDLATSGTLTFTAANEQSLRIEGERYQVHLIASGAASNGDNLSATLSSGSTSTPGTNAAAVVGTGASFVWTDGSAPGHSQSSNDWFNEFGLQQLPMVFSLQN